MCKRGNATAHRMQVWGKGALEACQGSLWITAQAVAVRHVHAYTNIILQLSTALGTGHYLAFLWIAAGLWRVS